MHISAVRRSVPILLMATVLMGVGCTGESDPVTTRPPEARAPTPSWTSPSPCIPDGAERTLNSDQFRTALECATSDFTWPEGKYPDIDWIMGAEEGSPYTWAYQIGSEHTYLGGLNQCAWYITWLDARRRGNTRLAQQALEQMTDIIPNFAEVIPGYPPDGRSGGIVQRDRAAAAAAALGDPSAVQQFVENHCTTIPFVPVPPRPSATQR